MSVTKLSSEIYLEFPLKLYYKLAIITASHQHKTDLNGEALEHSLSSTRGFVSAYKQLKPGLRLSCFLLFCLLRFALLSRNVSAGIKFYFRWLL